MIDERGLCTPASAATHAPEERVAPCRRLSGAAGARINAQVALATADSKAPPTNPNAVPQRMHQLSS